MVRGRLYIHGLNISIKIWRLSGVLTGAQWVNNPADLCGAPVGFLAQVQWVKDWALLQLWCGLKLQLGFDSWPGNFHTLQKWPKKKERKDGDLLVG